MSNPRNPQASRMVPLMMEAVERRTTINTVKALVPAVTNWICSTTGKVEADLVMPEAAYATSDAKTIATSKWWEDTLKLCIMKLR